MSAQRLMGGLAVVTLLLMTPLTDGPMAMQAAESLKALRTDEASDVLALRQPPNPIGIPGTRLSEFSALSASVVQTDAKNVELVGQIGGTTNAVFTMDNHAYIGVGPRLIILDISNRAAPALVGKTLPLPGGVCDVCVQGDHAYVAGCGAGLLIVNVSDPSAPLEVGAYDTPGSATGVVVDGGSAYVADGEAGLRVIDVSNTSNPVEVGACDALQSAWGVAVRGNIAYVADASNGLRVVDVGDLSDPVEIGTVDTPGDTYDVAVDGSTVYLADGHDGGLRVVDVSDPSNPVEIGAQETLSYATDVAVDGSTAYVADSETCLLVVDVSDPSKPVEIGAYDTPGHAEGVALSGSTAYVADGWGGMRVVDVGNLSNPEEIGTYESLARAEDVALDSSTAYVATRYEGLRVIDVSDPSNLVEIGAYDTPGATVGLALDGNVACVIGHTGDPEFDGWLRVVDVSDPSNPLEIGGYDTPGRYGKKVRLDGGTAFVVDTTGYPDDDGWLRVIDVSDPSSPVEVSAYDTPGRATDVALQGSTAYVADWSGGLRVIDVSDPSDPVELGACNPWGGAYAVTAEGSTAYVASYPGLYVIDVSDPSAPMELGAYWGYPNSSRRVAVDGSITWLTNGDRRSDLSLVYSNLYVVDVSDASNPMEEGAYLAPGEPRGVVLDGNTAYVANGYGGFNILRYTGRDTGRVYLPWIMRRWPPIPEPPTLYAISNPGGDGAYAVSWSAAERATSYVLQEAGKATAATDSDFTEAYSGWSISYAINGRGAARYHYRIKARNSWGDSGWSNVESVDVLWEAEPNDHAMTQANGPIVSGLTYYGTFPSGVDEKDYFTFELSSPHRIEVWLTNIPPGHDYDLGLRDARLDLVDLSDKNGNQDEHILTNRLPPGRYYVQVFNYGGRTSTQPYHLRVVYAGGE